MVRKKRLYSTQHVTSLHQNCAARLRPANEIAYATIVGYASSATVDGNKAVGANFIGVGGKPADVKLTDITVSGYTTEDFEDDAFPGLVVASKLNEYGSTIKEDGKLVQWTWVDWIEDGDRVTGWMDNNDQFVGVDVADVPVALGEGLWIQSDDPKWQIQCAGQVYDKPVPCQLVDGNRFCANPCPAAITLTKCVIGGYTTEDFEDDAFPGLVVASKLNEYGSTVKKDGKLIQWTWVDWIEDGEQVTGWMDNDDQFIGVDTDDVTISLGEALWVQSDSTQWQYIFPTVL